MRKHLQKLINEYHLIEELCADTSKKAHRARVALEQSLTDAPAPKGVTKKKKEEVLNKYRRSIMRRSVSTQ